MQRNECCVSWYIFGMDAKQESMRDLVQLFEFIPEIHFWIKDRKGRFLAANEAFIRHFGMKSFREMEGNTDFEVHPFPFAREYSLDDQLVASRKKVLANKLELVREKDGRLFRCELLHQALLRLP